MDGEGRTRPPVPEGGRRSRDHCPDGQSHDWQRVARDRMECPRCGMARILCFWGTPPADSPGGP